MLFNNIYEHEFLLDYYLYKINISFVKSGKKKKKNLSSEDRRKGGANIMAPNKETDHL